MIPRANCCTFVAVFSGHITSDAVAVFSGHITSDAKVHARYLSSSTLNVVAGHPERVGSHPTAARLDEVNP
jgi:hypothetical protein